jgi:hypothetical protein
VFAVGDCLFVCEELGEGLSGGEGGLECILPAGLLGCCVVCGGGRVVVLGSEVGGEEEGVFLW